jgi:hypothetical protein
MVIKAMRGQRGEYYIQYYSLWNDTSWFYLISEAGVILTSVAAVIVVVVEVISMRVVAVEEGGDYLDTSSSRSRSSSSGESPAWSLSHGQLTVL